MSEQQIAMVNLASEGLTSKEIAVRLGVGPRTVETQFRRMRDTLQTRNKTETIDRARELLGLGKLQRQEPTEQGIVREIRATYDGKVLIPTELLDLPVGQQITLHLEIVPGGPEPGTLEAVKKAFGQVDAPWFDPRKFQRGELYQ